MGLRRTARPALALSGAVGVAVLALLAVGGFVYTHRDRPVAAAARTSVVRVRRGVVTVSEEAAGTVQATNTRGLSFAVSGTVTKVAVKAGDTVTAGEVLAQIDDSDAADAVSSAQSNVANAEQSLSNAQASASATTSSTGCQATRASTGPGNCTSTAPQGRAGGTDSIYSAQQQLNNAKLALWQAKANLAGTVITAPIDGKVLTVTGTVGAAESPGDTAFITVTSTSDAQVRAQFSEADVARLAVGQAATISLASRTGTFAGKVSRIDPAGTASGQLVRYTVMIAFDKPPDDLLYGQSANVVVTTASVANVLYVSSSAVTTGSGDSGTVTVRTAGRDEPRTVQIGLRGDQYTEIRSGLSEGEQVVVSGGR